MRQAQCNDLPSPTGRPSGWTAATTMAGTAAVLLTLALPGGAVPLPAGGLELKDVFFTHPGAESSTTGVGLAVVDYSAYASAGFVNVEIEGEWAIQNLPVDPFAPALGIPGLSVYANLPVGAGDVSIRGDFSAVPHATFPDATAGPALVTKAPPIEVNAQGFDARPVAPAELRQAPPAAQPGPLAFNPAGVTELLGFQPGHTTNVEQDVNQCCPGAMANSLDYLRNRFGIPVPHDNVPGVAGNPPNSLVGQIDLATGRGQGQTVGWEPKLTGKLDYLDDNDLRLVVKHQTSDDAPAAVRQDVASTSGDLTSTFRGDITARFILSELARGENVELGLFWDTGGGHFVDLVGGGRILGVPWIASQHDARQGFDAENNRGADNGGVGLFDGGYGFSFLVDTNMDGRLNFHNLFDGAGAEVVYVISQSPVPEPSTLALLAAGALTLLLAARLSRHRRTDRGAAAA